MSSPICTVNGNTTGNGVNVAANTTFTIELADTAGVKTWSLTCISTDDHQSPSAISSSILIDSITKTATCISPNVTDGAAMIFESKINGGIDINGRNDPTLTTRFGVFVLTDLGSLRVGAFDEILEGSASYGWLTKFNAAVRAAGVAGSTPTISGTLPIVVNNANPVAPVISINAATTGASGSMSAADKQALDNATSNATANRIAKRGASGQCSFSQVDTQALSSSTGYIQISADGTGVIYLDGTTDAELHCGMPVNANRFKLQTDNENEPRSIPLDWSACKVGGVESWSINADSDVVNDVQDPLANLSIECHFLNGSKIKSLTIRHQGAGSGVDPLAANPPTFTLYRKPIATGVPTVIATISSTLDGTYRGNFRDETIDLSMAPHAVDTTNARYYLVVTTEVGSNAIAGAVVRGLSGVIDFPAGMVVGLG